MVGLYMYMYMYIAVKVHVHVQYIYIVHVPTALAWHATSNYMNRFLYNTSFESNGAICLLLQWSVQLQLLVGLFSNDTGS